MPIAKFCCTCNRWMPARDNTRPAVCWKCGTQMEHELEAQQDLMWKQQQADYTREFYGISKGKRGIEMKRKRLETQTNKLTFLEENEILKAELKLKEIQRKIAERREQEAMQAEPQPQPQVVDAAAAAERILAEVVKRGVDLSMLQTRRASDGAMSEHMRRLMDTQANGAAPVVEDDEPLLDDNL